MNVHGIIDRFVDSIGSPGADFKPNQRIDWTADFEAKLPQRFPLSFHSLISRYSFNSFDYNGLLFFSNNDSEDGLSIALFKDRFISEMILQNGFIQFARPSGGSYDPICFDANIARSRREFPIVRIDHESILCRNKIRITEKISDSFLKFAQESIFNA